MVVKRDGRREPFEREKVAVGIRKACEKRPIPADVQNRLVDEICREINNSLDAEISTKEIGEMVMKKLRDVDEVAYVRFASVYRQFKDVNTFIAEIEKLLGSGAGGKLKKTVKQPKAPALPEEEE